MRHSLVSSTSSRPSQQPEPAFDSMLMVELRELRESMRNLTGVAASIQEQVSMLHRRMPADSALPSAPCSSCSAPAGQRGPLGTVSELAAAAPAAGLGTSSGSSMQPAALAAEPGLQAAASTALGSGTATVPAQAGAAGHSVQAGVAGISLELPASAIMQSRHTASSRESRGSQSPTQRRGLPFSRSSTSQTGCSSQSSQLRDTIVLTRRDIARAEDPYKSMGGSSRLTTNPFVRSARDVYVSEEGRSTTIVRRISLLSNNSLLSAMGHVLCWTGTGQAKRKCTPLHPSSQVRLAIDLLSLAALLYDLITVPYLLAFDAPLQGALLVVSCVTLGFWTLDLVLNFFTGSLSAENHRISVNLKEIAVRYIKTWFFLDLAVLIADVLGVVAELVLAEQADSVDISRYAKLARFGKLGRLVRVMALMRTGRFTKLYARLILILRNFAQPHQVHFAFSIIKIFFLIIWLNHIGACTWYVVGNLPEETDTGVTWRELLNEDNILFHGVEWTQGYMYLTGLYWSTTSMISGASFMVPTNSYESVFSLSYLIFGLLFSSTLISHLAATLIQFESLNQERTSKIRTLQRFLHQHKVDSLLSMHIQKQAHQRTTRATRLFFADVSVLPLLSASLRSELNYCVFARDMLRHELLRICDRSDETLVRHLCASAGVQDAATPGTQVFAASQDWSQVLFVLSGTLEYTSSFDPAMPSEPYIVESPDRVCEISLWVAWRTKGMLEVATPCEILSLNAKTFGDVLSWRAHRGSGLLARCYGSLLCDAIERDQPMAFGDLTTGIDYDAVVVQMPSEVRLDISQPLLQVLRVKAPRRSVCDIEADVKNAKCHLSLDSQGRIFRVMHVAIARLVTADYRVCVEIGYRRSGENVATMMLPGTKVRGDETPEEALQRLIHSRLPMFETCMEDRPGAMEVDVQFSPSTTHGYDSKFIRRQFNLAVTPDLGTLPATPGIQGEQPWRCMEVGNVYIPGDQIFCVPSGQPDLFGRAGLDGVNEEVMRHSVSPKASQDDLSSACASPGTPMHRRVNRESATMIYCWMPAGDWETLCNFQSHDVSRAAYSWLQDNNLLGSASSEAEVPSQPTTPTTRRGASLGFSSP